MATENPFARGLFVPLGGDDAKNHRGLTLMLGGQAFDPTPYFQATVQLGNYITQFGAAPYNPLPLLKMQQMSKNIRPSLMAAANHPNPAIRQAAAPMVHGMQAFLSNSNKLIQMRLRTSHQIARAPKILVPISMSIAAGGSLTAVQVRNPYLGASGGATGQYQSPWAITSFRTSNGESGALLPIRISQFLIGGHDFVAAALAGLTYTAGGAPATQGWPAAAFAETKRGNWKTEVQPWNVVAQNGGGTGFGSVMTETGFLQVSVFNGGAQTYVDTYSVYCNATLCGSPFAVAQWTQIDAFRKAFQPLNLQTQMAMKLAGDSDGWVRQAIAPDDPSVSTNGNPYLLIERLAQLQGNNERLLESPPAGMAMGDGFIDPRSAGFELIDDAEYVG